MIELKNICKTYDNGDADIEGSVEALKGVSLRVEDGDIFGIIGLSGAGKSTLVRCINLLERPTSGEVWVDGENMCALSEKELRLKRHDITMIFQGINLLMQRTNLRNVSFPLELLGTPKAEARARAAELLEMVGLADKAAAYPAKLSGGERQRVAIARALATSPKVLLCDEATSALDPATTSQILSLIKDINEKLGITVVIITHAMSVVESACRHVAILDGGRVAEMGEVQEIFAHPKSEAARRLFYPEENKEGLLDTVSEDCFVRLIFNGEESTGRPIIAALACKLGIEANILNASVRNIGDRVFGSMLLGINREKREDALRFFAEEGVQAEEVLQNE